jgi:hypothetical protein
MRRATGEQLAMAGQYAIYTQSVSLTAATAKTLIELPTGAGASLIIVGLELGSAATSAGSMVLEWGTLTTTGTGSATTPTKVGANQGPAANLGTVKTIMTVEGTTFVPIWSTVIPLPGMYSILYPSGREPYQPISTLRYWRCTSTVTAAVRFNLTFEQ